MVCPQDGNGGDDLVIWKVAPNVLDKQRQGGNIVIFVFHPML